MFLWSCQVKSFFFSLKERVKEVDSNVCVGIDPHFDYFDNNSNIKDKLIQWSMALVEKTHEHAACFKVNIAFFEEHGSEGIRALEKIIPQIQKIAPLILDAKRGDISSTTKSYAKAYFEGWGVKSVTVNPFIWEDSFEPLLKYPQAGVFLLCHTSNSRASELQRRIGEDKLPLYAWIAKKINSHPLKDQIGLVVGATQQEIIANVRKYVPSTWLLCPGIGIQQGNLYKTITNGWGNDGHILITSSRSIAESHDPTETTKKLKEKIQIIKG